MFKTMLLAVALVAYGQPAASAPPSIKPVVAGPEGQRAFDDLANFYAGGKAFWAALILLKHTDKDRAEALDILARDLAGDEGTYLYSRAIEPLLAAGTEPALKLAVGILPKLTFDHSSSDTGPILHRLFLAVRQECLDYLLEMLANEESHGTSGGDWKGMRVERQHLIGDWAAEIVMEWRRDDVRYERLAPDEMRRASREQTKVWLKEQFALLKGGSPTQLKSPDRLQFGGWHVDAP